MSSYKGLARNGPGNLVLLLRWPRVDEDEDHAHALGIAILPGLQGKGLGASLMEYVTSTG